MDAQEYATFTRELGLRLERDPAVLGLVALGSTAAREILPDRWSDHDFFVVVAAGEQERLRTDLSWLPRAGDIAVAYRETAHGLKVLYQDGHLLEFAVFDPQELALARVNRFRVLLDRGDVQARVAETAAATAWWLRDEAPSDPYLVGQLLTGLVTAAGRFRRGERLSADQRLRESVRCLVVLLSRHVPAAQARLLDDLDPLRRFERVYEGLSGEIAALLHLDVPVAAGVLLQLCERELEPKLPALAAGLAAARRGLG